MKTKQDVFTDIFTLMTTDGMGHGCTDYEIPNTPELFQMLEEFGMRNLNLTTLEEFRAHPEYEDYKPYVIDDGLNIHTQTWIVAKCLQYELIQKGIINP